MLDMPLMAQWFQKGDRASFERGRVKRNVWHAEYDEVSGDFRQFLL